MTSEQNPETIEALWAFEPLFDGLKQGRELLQLAHLSERGILFLEERYEHLQQFAEFKDILAYDIAEPVKSCIKSSALGRNVYLRLPMESLEDYLEIAEEEAKAATEERRRNYARLNDQAFVSAWGMLEDTIRLFLVSWLANRPDARRVAIGKIGKTNLSDFDPLDEEETLFFIVEQLFSKGQGKGANRYENLLGIFGLSGPVKEDPDSYAGDGEVYGRERILLEGHYLRDVLVHRRGIIDRKTKEQCPALHYEVGDPVHFTGISLQVFVLPMLEYIGLVIDRVVDKLDLKRPFGHPEYEYVQRLRG